MGSVRKLRGITSIIALVGVSAVTVVYLISLFDFIFPIIHPLLLEERFWLSWLIIGVFIGPNMLLIAYVSIKATNSKNLNWNSALRLLVLVSLYLTALGFLFSLILPSHLEPFRSITLPAIILGLTFVIFSKTKYAKRFQDS